MKIKKIMIEKKIITDNLNYELMSSINNETIYLKVDYMNGKYIVEKTFNNNYLGLARMNKEIIKFDKEEKVIKYLGLEDNKNE